MTSKFSRFLHLERSRGERPKPDEPSRLQGGGRFEALVEGGGAPQGAAVPEAHLERFKGQAPLALAELPAEAELQRFPRCGRCESDNSRYAKECGVCGADLTTPQQREYNERFWQARQQALDQEREAVAALEQQRRQSAQEQQGDAARYALLMAKLREQEQAPRWLSHFHRRRGLGLLELIRNPLIRWGVLAVCIVVPPLLWIYGPTREVRSVGSALTVIALVLFLPTRPRW